MSNPNGKIPKVNIGGVQFNKNDVAKSEVVKQKDGKISYSVFLRDGTKMVYPAQAGKNEAIVSMNDKTEKSPMGYSVMDGEFKMDYGTDPTMINPERKTGDVEIDFYRISGAEITGTNKKDDYTLRGCRNSKVDISQNDGKFDSVHILNDTNKHGEKLFTGEKVPLSNQHSQDGKVFLSGNNEVKQNAEDETLVPNKNRESIWDPKLLVKKGKGTVKE